MGSKTRLSFYCTKRANNGGNLVTSRKINTRLARPLGRGRTNWTSYSITKIPVIHLKREVEPRFEKYVLFLFKIKLSDDFFYFLMIQCYKKTFKMSCKQGEI